MANPHTDEVWLANDEGIYRYEDNTQWQDMSHGIVTGEIYKIGQSPFDGNHAMNGYQDNGTYLFNGVQWSRGSGGDGFECIYDPNDPEWFFSSSQYGRIIEPDRASSRRRLWPTVRLASTKEGRGRRRLPSPLRILKPCMWAS